MNFQSLYEFFSAYPADSVTLLGGVFVSTFVVEEGAVVLAVLLVLSGKLSPVTSFLALYLGVIGSDVGLYGLGLAARRYSWASGWVNPVRLQHSGEWIGKNLIPAVLLSRLLPWILPPTFIACGFFRQPFKQFLWLTASTGALWTLVFFTFTLKWGTALQEWGNAWVWGLSAALLLGLFFWKRRQKTDEGDPPASDVAVQTCRLATPTQCWFEKIPTPVFYAPVFLLWLLLSLRHRSLTLPTVANPKFETGGLFGESKEQIFSLVQPEGKIWFASHAVLQRSTVPWEVEQDVQRGLAAMAKAGLSFPIVVKPDRGHHGYGVMVVHDQMTFASYIGSFPLGQNIILQRLVPFNHEAGVFYTRLPGQRQGAIFSLNLSHPAHVVGDGHSNLRLLIQTSTTVARNRDFHLAAQACRLDWVPKAGEEVLLAFARSHRLGAQLVDARSLVTEALRKRFDQIADQIPEFHFGRFEVRFRSLEEFLKGEGFQIVELNGAGAESNHIWDPRTSLRQAYGALYKQYRLLFRIGRLNRARGFQPISLRELSRFLIAQEALLGRYPR